mmetsp:Transcript_52786/g.125653  ORF Transcript_52786/g.125653 Transcript_52786/m.125653 type:complete len:514 (-) Transcript_52786:1-1542(-)
MPESGSKRERSETTYDGSPEFGTFRRTLRFLFSVAVERALPNSRTVGGNPVGNGYWYLIDDQDNTTQGDVDKIAAEMKKLVDLNAAISEVTKPHADAIAYLEKANQPYAAKLLAKRVPRSGLVPMHSITIEGTDYLRLKLSPLLPASGKVEEVASWGLVRYKGGGLILFFGDVHHDQEAMRRAVKELRDWNKHAGVRCAGDLADQEEIENKQALYVHAAEARLEQKIADAAHAIAARGKEAPLRVVCIAGPTASGKTTFSHKLSLALQGLGVRASPLTVDHYYLPLDEQPKFKVRGERGDVDYDSIESMDLVLVQKHIMALTEGEKVLTPIYNMKTGFRDPGGRELSLPQGGILIIEGIHALNPAYTAQIDAASKFNIFISPMTTLQVDDFNVIKSTDHRLTRRMSRDFLFRGHSALRTLAMWGNVRRGEHRWIFPHQNHADFVFNSAMECELPMLKPRVETLLRQVPASAPEFGKAQLLLSHLDAMPAWQESAAASTSLLREFIGGGALGVH